MEGYLKGFQDGYNKALEQLERGAITVSIQLDNKEIAQDIYNNISELQEKENRIKKTF